jgi:hypothetical protein
MKNLIVCGNCLTNGTKSVLGEIDENGYFAILRFHNGYTRIVGKDFAVLCGGCGEPTYIRKGADGTADAYGFIGQSVVNYTHNEWSYTGTNSGVGVGSTEGTN